MIIHIGEAKMSLKRKFFLMAPIAALVSLAGVSSHAQEACLERQNAISKLQNRYGENISARGLASNGKAMIELLTSQDGSWTMLITTTDGRTCIFGSGHDWMVVEPKPSAPAV